jgi:hypothetical protein
MKITITAAAAAMALMLAACGTSTSTSPDEQSAVSKIKTAKVGSTITLHGYDEKLQMALTVNKVTSNAEPADEYKIPKDGNRFFSVEVTIKNVGDLDYDDALSNGATVVDSEGQPYEATVADVAGAELHSMMIAKGDFRKGVLVFEVLNKAKIVKLQIVLDSGSAPSAGEWTLA